MLDISRRSPRSRIELPVLGKTIEVKGEWQYFQHGPVRDVEEWSNGLGQKILADDDNLDVKDKFNQPGKRVFGRNYIIEKKDGRKFIIGEIYTAYRGDLIFPCSFTRGHEETHIVLYFRLDSLLKELFSETGMKVRGFHKLSEEGKCNAGGFYGMARSLSNPFCWDSVNPYLQYCMNSYGAEEAWKWIRNHQHKKL